MSYNKRKLVLAVVKAWIDSNKPETLADLLKAFPQETRRGGLFVPLQEANEIYKRQGIARHFVGEDEVIRFRSGETYAVSNQWGSGNIERFVESARSLGLEIEESS